VPIQYPNNVKPTDLTKENNRLYSSSIEYGLNISYPFNTQIFPFDTDKTTLDLAKSKINLLLDIDFGEWRYKPNYGIGLNQYIFENINVAVLSNIEDNIKEQISTWVPEVKLKAVRVTFDGKTLITIDLNYSLKEDNRQSDSITKKIEIY